MTKINKLIHQFIGEKVEYDKFGTYIWGVKGIALEMIGEVPDKRDIEELSKDREDSPVLSVRGWGAIQHIFADKDKAAEFQDAMGKWIAEAINEKLERERNEK